MKDPAKGGVYVDCWHIPGGGIDEGEDKMTALKREILEETGININPYPIELVDDKGRGQSEKILKTTGEKVLCDMIFNVYKIVINDKDANQINVSLNDDLVKYTWTDPKDLGVLKLTPPSVDLFDRLGYLKKLTTNP
jgi:8-oxo-dGTP pyrophosphatase MutT (NUDIX family)